MYGGPGQDAGGSRGVQRKGSRGDPKVQGVPGYLGAEVAFRGGSANREGARWIGPTVGFRFPRSLFVLSCMLRRVAAQQLLVTPLSR